MQAIATAIGYVLGKIVSLANFFIAVFVQLFTDLWEFITDAFVWVFDQALGLVVSILSALDVTPITNGIQGMGSLPGQVLEVLGALGLGQALGVIGAAITVRLGLQLIPFTRLGS